MHSQCESLLCAMRKLADAVARNDIASVEATTSRIEELASALRSNSPEYPPAIGSESARLTAILARGSATLAALIAVHATAEALYPTGQLGGR